MATAVPSGPPGRSCRLTPHWAPCWALCLTPEAKFLTRRHTGPAHRTAGPMWTGTPPGRDRDMWTGTGGPPEAQAAVRLPQGQASSRLHKATPSTAQFQMALWSFAHNLGRGPEVFSFLEFRTWKSFILASVPPPPPRASLLAPEHLCTDHLCSDCPELEAAQPSHRVSDSSPPGCSKTLGDQSSGRQTSFPYGAEHTLLRVTAPRAGQPHDVQVFVGGCGPFYLPGLQDGQRRPGGCRSVLH